MKLIYKLNAVIAVVVAGLVACGGGGGGGATASNSDGSLRIAMTDAPGCGYSAVNVTIQKIRVHMSSSASDTDTGWSEVVLSPAKRVDLLTLSNGILSEMGQTALPAGKYTQLRLVLASNDAANPLLNSVVPTGGVEVALKSPSGAQSGIKANVNIDIAANKMADFVVDFDACKSVVTAGGSGQYLLKPVISVLPRYISGVAGFVDVLTLANGNTSVSLQQNGDSVKATAPDGTGKFTLQPVAPGTYSLVLTAPGRTTTVVTGVVVASETVTSINLASTALTSAVSLTGTVSGTAPVDTYVRALQPLTNGTTVEVNGKFVDSVGGGYSFSLPVNAPLVAPYVAAPTALVFAADTAVAGKYTTRASLTGFADKTTVLGTLAAGAIVSSNFTFP